MSKPASEINTWFTPEDQITPETGICGDFRQPMYDCPNNCGRWSTDPRWLKTHKCAKGS